MTEAPRPHDESRMWRGVIKNSIIMFFFLPEQERAVPTMRLGWWRGAGKHTKAAAGRVGVLRDVQKDVFVEHCASVMQIIFFLFSLSLRPAQETRPTTRGPATGQASRPLSGQKRHRTSILRRMRAQQTARCAVCWAAARHGRRDCKLHTGLGR